MCYCLTYTFFFFFFLCSTGIFQGRTHKALELENMQDSCIYSIKTGHVQYEDRYRVKCSMGAFG